MLKFNKKQNNQKGSVSIEATIALTAFLFMFIMIYSIITVCRAQARVQIAIDSTAKELSQYSYIYGLTGLDESLAKFQEGGQETKDDINGVIGNVVGMFEGIQSLGDTGASLELGDIDSVLSSWDSVTTDLNNVSQDYSSAKAKIEEMADNPQALLLGMAKLIGSEALEVGKSKAIAEPVCRALVQKHLKRSNGDTADAYCRAIGIIPDIYFGTKSYFNGLDFSNSTLFPYGSDEITIIVTYKVKILQLLPVDLEFNITQSAVTRGWLHGDKSSNGEGSQDRLDAITAKGENIWNNATLDERVTLIRNMGVAQLKSEGYYGVSGETYIQAYDPTSKTFILISSANPLYGIDSLDSVNKEDIKTNLERLAAQMKSATDNKTTIKVKKTDVNGNMIAEDVDCSGNHNKKVIVVIPEDAGLKELFEEAAAELGSDVSFEFQQSYGSVFVAEKEGGED